MPELRLRIDKYLPGGGANMGAVAEISRLDDPAWFREDVSMIMVPAGEDVPPARVDLPKGVYGVQVRMPSGRFVNKRVDLRKKARVDLFVEADRSRNETLSWQSYVGNVPTELEMQKREILRSGKQAVNAAPVVAPRIKTVTRDRDDLKRLRGIGPATERILVSRGIDSFERIADLGDQSLNWVDSVLPGIRKRLHNHDWGQQARNILETRADSRPDMIVDDVTSDPGPVIADAVTGQSTDAYLFDLFEDGVDPVPTYDTVELCAHDTSISGAHALASAAAVTVPVQISSIAIVTEGPATITYEIEDIPARARGSIRRRAGFNRTYAAISDAGCDWLVALPFPWISTRRYAPVAIDLSSDIDDPTRPRVSVLPRDEQLAPLIGFMSGGNVRVTHAIAKSAMESLFEKIANPYAAALGGVVLVSAMLSGEDRSRSEGWHKWVSNLSDWYPWMADAHVLRAWLILLTRSQDPSEARALFLHAARCGLPVYGQSLRFLVDGLRWCRSGDEADTEVNDALNRIDLAALRLDTDAVFTTIRLSSWPQRVVPQ